MADMGEAFGMHSALCNTCAHVYPDMSTCEAFPDGEGIPSAIMSARNLHLQAYPGDHSIHYEYAPGLGPKPKWAP